MNLIIYLFPMLNNFVLGGMFFITAYRFSHEGASPFVTGLAIAVWALIYSLCSLVMGKITTSRNAPFFIILAGLIMALGAIGFLLFPGLYTQFLWISIVAFGNALYCTPFQIYMKSLEPDADSGIVHATSLYTFSWSFGMAFGPFLFALMSPRTGFLINAGAGFFIAGTVAMLQIFHQEKEKTGTAQKTVAASPEKLQKPDYAMIGWLVGGIGTLTICQLRSMWPVLGEALAIPKSQIGLVLAVQNLAQAFCALALIRSKDWFYKAGNSLLVGLFGVISLCCFAFQTTIPGFYAGAILYGIYSGSFYFFFVFHALANEKKAVVHVAVNEAVVGVTSVIGPILGGWAVSAAGPSTPFWGAAVLTALVTILPVVVFRKSRISG